MISLPLAGQSLDNAVVALIVTGQLLPFGRPQPRQQPGKPAVDHSTLLRFIGASAPTPQPNKACLQDMLR